MQIDAAGLTLEQSYKLLTGIVVPRPIAWVTTLNASGRVNLAPFSAFTFVSHCPPMVAISVGVKGDGMKDTGHNILATREFVVNIADPSFVEAVNASAVEFAPDVSEVDALGLETSPGTLVATPRLAGVPVSLECRFHSCIEFGEQPSRLMVGEVLRFHVRDGLLVNGKINTAELNPLCRLGGPHYATLGRTLTMSRQAQAVQG